MDDVTASELAAYAYCAKAWHLERVVGVEASAEAARRRDVGTAGHERHGAVVRTGSQLRQHSRSLIFVLLVLAGLFTSLAIITR